MLAGRGSFFFLPLPGPLGFLLGGGGLLLGGAGVWAGICDGSGAATCLVDIISPSMGCPFVMVISSVYGFPAASILLTVAFVIVSPPGGATTVLDAMVTVPFRLFARWIMSSTFREMGFHVLTAKPRVLVSSSSFFSSFSGGPSASGSSSSMGEGRL